MHVAGPQRPKNIIFWHYFCSLLPALFLFYVFLVIPSIYFCCTIYDAKMLVNHTLVIEGGNVFSKFFMNPRRPALFTIGFYIDFQFLYS